MKHNIIILLIISIQTSSVLYCQERIQKKIERLKYVSDMPYICRDTIGSFGCGDSIFWDIIVENNVAIPFLLDALDDTTKTIAEVPNFGGVYTVADIAYQALGELIIGIPTFDLLGIPFDRKGCGYCSYWFHLRESHSNRVIFKAKVIDWYSKNENRLQWVESRRVLTCDCSFNHPNGGYLKVKD